MIKMQARYFFAFKISLILAACIRKQTILCVACKFVNAETAEMARHTSPVRINLFAHANSRNSSQGHKKDRKDSSGLGTSL